ncbi:6-carboxytetrahydropterin synthase QueD [Macrococcoides caseolyticum]|uniref:6-carboxy-5,6,7,8-tetrahydropterin synthase n=1 Tax=Macrococcus psychrotolerans TaxID=3039389 RepID=A0AAU6RMQ9_9STAP|nr:MULTISPECIES: 6-carboxytetrahydropterin synthase QueD [Macrococcus]ARQ03818.1 6-carboxy-5,6,7,8-tetrahydropterin synthase [Macrococcus caseolyticus]PKD99841.1 6-carboxytetrahydropterin synthase QueD [Macrococcus caseolyticus]PKE06942.1 6-carboxytetrahydropterin synthase QueD [Macrococcus caseolyticus]PKE12897.1 6-carboxytetrahydropterin synthase QueD [Macrococcus caseolyticus]PKE24310.1 6-carboxytetrahydropterin synthase QueD [Macrococcus caseolyticus]
MMQQLYPQVNHNYAFELNKDINFSAAHFIPNEKAGVCSRVHGHTYFANVTIGGNELDEMGFLVNFRDIKSIINDTFDHRLMNDLEAFQGTPPSTESVAKLIFEKIEAHLDTLSHGPKVLQVYLRETPTSYVLYRGKR